MKPETTYKNAILALQDAAELTAMQRIEDAITALWVARMLIRSLREAWTTGTTATTIEAAGEGAVCNGQ